MRPILTDFSVVCRSVCHTSEPCKNGWTNWDAVRVENLGRPRESRYPMGRGNFHKKGRPIEKYRNTLQSSVQTRLNRSRCHLGCGLGWDEAEVQSYSPGGANLPDDTLPWAWVVDSGGSKEAQVQSIRQVVSWGHIGTTWRIWLNHPSAVGCGLISNYFESLTTHYWHPNSTIPSKWRWVTPSSRSHHICITKSACVVQWLDHSDAMCSRAWRALCSAGSRFNSSRGLGKARPPT